MEWFFLRTYESTPDRSKKNFLALGKQKVFSATEIQAVFIRLEPPFHLEYLNHTWFLDLIKKDCFIMNDPTGIRSVNEKVWATRFPKLLPHTCITRKREDCLAFLKKEKEIIAKPLDGFGGSAVFKLKQGDSNVSVILEVLSKNFSEEIMLQNYLSAAKFHGDKSNNFFTGGKAEAAEITPRDKEIVATISPYLKLLKSQKIY